MDMRRIITNWSDSKRIQVAEAIDKSKNKAKACSRYGISQKSFYTWKKKFDIGAAKIVPDTNGVSTEKTLENLENYADSLATQCDHLEEKNKALQTALNDEISKNRELKSLIVDILCGRYNPIGTIEDFIDSLLSERRKQG